MELTIHKKESEIIIVRRRRRRRRIKNEVGKKKGW